MTYKRKIFRLKRKKSDSTVKSGISKELILAVLMGLQLLPQYVAPSICSAANLYGTETTGEDGITYYTAEVSDGNSYDNVIGSYYYSDSTTSSGSGSYGKVNVTGGSVSGDVIGGYSESGAAGGNSVSISGGTISGDVTGGYSYSGSAGYDSTDYGNSVTITGGTITGDIYGGNTKSGDAAYNSVTIEGSDTDSVKMTLNNIYGGYSETGSAAYNSVSVSGGGDSSDSSSSVTLGSSKTVDGVVYYTHIYGGYSVSGDARKNTVSISGDVSVDGNICGGYSVSGDADGNTVYMGSDSDAENTSRPLSEHYIYGGYSESGGASDNEVYFSSGNCWNHVYGGYSEAEESSESAVSSNYVSVGGGYILGAVYGGYSANTDVGGSTTDEDGNTVSLGNTVEISGGYIYGGITYNYYGGVYGGYSEKGDVSYNTVKMTGGEVAGPYNGYGGIMGGYSDSGSVSYNSVEISGADSLVGSLVLTVSDGNQDRFVIGGYSYSGSATYNSVTISDGTFYTGISGGASLGSASVSNNTVTISGGSFYGSSYGSVMGGLSYSGSATGNEVEITGGTFYDTYNSSSSSAYADIYGGYSGMGSATYNSVKIGGEEAVTIYGDVYGGYVYYSQSGSASYNSVSIGGGEEAVTIKGDVYGGYGYYYASASNNSVELLGATEISGTVHGGLSVYGGNSSSNSLTVANTENTAGGLSNFSTITFDVSGLEAEDVMLTLTSSDAISLDNAVITVDGLTQESDEAEGSSSYALELGAGEKITLLTAENSSLTDFYLGSAENSDSSYSYGTELYTLADTSETYSISGSYSLDLTTETDDNSDVTSVVLVAGSEINVTDVILATSGESSDDASDDTVSSATLSLDWYVDSLLTLESGLTYDFSDANLETADSVTISGISGTLLAAGDSFQLIDGTEATVSGLEALVAGATNTGESALSATYSYEPASGVTVSGAAAYIGIDTDSSGDATAGLALSVGTIGEITFGGITYSESPLITLAEGTSYDLSDTVIDVSNLAVVDSEGNAVTVTLDDSEITAGGTVYMTLIEASENTGLSVSSAATSQSFGYTLTNEGNSLTGAMDGIVTVKDYDLVLAVDSNVAVSELTLDTSSLEWGAGALLTLNDSLSYDFASASAPDLSDSVAITGVSGTLLASSDSMTLLEAGSASVSGLASLVSDASATYSYEPASGVTVTGNAAYSASDEAGISIGVSSIDAITFGEITYSDSALITLDTDKTYDLSSTSVDVSSLTVVDSEGSPVSVTYDDSEIADSGTVYMTLIEASEDTGLSVSNASTSQSFGYTLTNEKNSLTGAMDGIVTVKDYDLVLAADSNIAVSELTLDTSALEWGAGALLTLNDSLTYDFSDSSLDVSDSVAITGVSGTLLAASDAMTLLDVGSASVSGLASLVSDAAASYSYEPASGVTVAGSAAYSASDEDGISVGVSSIDSITFSEITYSDSALITLDTDKTYDLSETAIDVSSLTVVDSEGSAVSVTYDDSELNEGGTVYMTLIDASEATGLSVEESATSQSFGYTLTNGENYLAGTMAGIVSVKDYDLVLAADSAVSVSEISLDTSSLEWGSDALLTLNDSLAYDFTSASVSGLDETSITTGSFLDVDASTTLVDTASAEVTGLSALEGSAGTYSYSLLDGVVTVTGSGSLTVSTGSVDYTIASIDTMDFYITAGTESGSTILSVSTADLSGTAISAYAEGGSYLTEGYEVTLLEAEDGLTTDASTSYTVTITEGVSVEYTVDIYQDGDSIIAVVASDDTEDDSSDVDSETGSDADSDTGSDTDSDNSSDADSDTGSDTDSDSSSDTDSGTGSDADSDTGTDTDSDTGSGEDSDEDDGSSSPSGTSLRSETKSLVETRLAQLAMLEQGAELLANAASDKTTLAESVEGWTPFAAMNRTSYKYDTGSYVDIDGFNAVVGILKTDATPYGNLTYGAAFQYGSGEYESHAEGVRARGDTEYTGGSLFARHQWHSGAYAELSLSRGDTEGDYKSSEILDGVSCSYKDDAPYWGASLGVGRELKLGYRKALDVYARYFYSHINDSSVKLSTGEVYDFDSTDSSRLRLGARYTRDLSQESRYYAGLAYEYQFDGAARATYNGMSTLSPSLEGSSGMLEAGVLFAPQGSNLSIDLGVTGWAGTRKGVEGRLMFNISF